MRDELEGFLPQIPDLAARTPAELVEYFVFFLTVIRKQVAAAANEVADCFELTRLKSYSNIPAYLANHTRGKTPKFLRTNGGYQLERNRQLEIQKTLHTGPAKIETSHLLRGLLAKVHNSQQQSFLQEAVDCYEIGARRAAIILVWILVVHHLYEYIWKNHLVAFNAELAKNTDKRIKITAINKVEDFGEIPEGKFIEMMRAANIITNDVRKILETKLGIRNTSAHPSSVVISDVKATDFILDLIQNVLLPFKI